ncbi:MAG TPA: alpha/beta fold hydrolase [Sphingobium sp.]|uniref:alpha/beta fold hydrolase n=1 Tax=Sphingobium sp. TaxID=1912891 RepID=UPI002ED69578
MTASQTGPVDPAAIVADLEARARRFETPCGTGSLIWHVWGEGPPVLLAHGSHGSWSHWIRTIDALATRRTVWVPDLPGFGASAMPPGEGHDIYSAVLAEGLWTLVREPADLVGFSFGGVALAWLAAQHPDIARRLIVVGSGGLGTPVGEIMLGRVRGLEGAEREAANRANLLGLMLHAPESVDALAIHLQELNGFRGRLRASPYVLPDRLLEVLSRVPMQVDAIWGEHDRPHPVPARQEAAIRSVRPELDFRVIEGAGHWVMYERAEAFNATLIEMLDTPLRED